MDKISKRCIIFKFSDFVIRSLFSAGGPFCLKNVILRTCKLQCPGAFIRINTVCDQVRLCPRLPKMCIFDLVLGLAGLHKKTCR